MMSTSPVPRCQIIPTPGHQVAFQIDGGERLRWHFGAESPRPFFYPLTGSSGSPLTRMGHPGAPNHDHHRSIWFAHHKVLGINFWGDNTEARIRQQQWLAYEDGQDECKMATRLGWYDGHDPQALMTQELIAAVMPLADNETILELQSTFTPTAESIELGQTNFGFLAVRVAANLSVHFGGGKLTDSEGRAGEPAIFGNRAQWMDYSGPVRSASTNDSARDVVEGITYFDHPENPRHPSRWHVREDGWMGASLCMDDSLMIRRDQPLVLRYLLHAHSGGADHDRAAQIFTRFSERPSLTVQKSTRKHRHFEVRRIS